MTTLRTGPDAPSTPPAASAPAVVGAPDPFGSASRLVCRECGAGYKIGARYAQLAELARANSENTIPAGGEPTRLS